MTATQVIWLLFIGMMVNFAGMRYFWLRSEKAEDEVKKLKKENERLEKENAEKARQLAEWGKYAPFLYAHGFFREKED